MGDMLDEMISQVPKSSVIPGVYMVPLEEAKMAWCLCILSAEAFFPDSLFNPHRVNLWLRYSLDH